MNDQSNPVGTDQTEMTERANERRRLVRGAVALAPVVLTLRSGALAAASCTGAKALGVGTDDKGKFTAPSGSNVTEGDYCVASAQQCGNTSKISSGTIDASPIYKKSNKLYCGTTKSQPVAILSSTAVTSLRG